MVNEYQIRVVPEVAAQEDRLKVWLADERPNFETKYRCPSAADFRQPQGAGLRK